MNKTHKLLCKVVFHFIAAHVSWIPAMSTKRMAALFQRFFEFMFWQACFLAPILDVAATVVHLYCGGNIQRDKGLGPPEIKHKIAFSSKTLLLVFFSLLQCTIILVIVVKCPSSHL